VTGGLPACELEADGERGRGHFGGCGEKPRRVGGADQALEVGHADENEEDAVDNGVSSLEVVSDQVSGVSIEQGIYLPWERPLEGS
jgi:hypothetical protein